MKAPENERDKTMRETGFSETFENATRCLAPLTASACVMVLMTGCGEQPAGITALTPAAITPPPLAVVDLQVTPAQESLNRGLVKASSHPCDPDAVRFYLDKGADPDAQLAYRNEPLEAALGAVADFYRTTNESRSARRLQPKPDDAARCEDVAIALIEAGANPDRWLALAVEVLSPRVVEAMLAHGADANTARSGLGDTRARLPIELLMAEFPADMAKVDVYGEARAERGNAVFELLFAQLDMTAFNNSRHDTAFGRGLPPLTRLLSVSTGQPDLQRISFWLEAGADPCATSDDGKTAADVALELSDLAAYQLLDRCS